MNAEPSAVPDPAGAPVIRVVVADDHPVVRAGMAGVLNAAPDISVVGEADDGNAAVRLAVEHDADVVLMDLRMPGMDGVAATAALAQRAPRSKVVVVTTYDTDADIMRAVEAGAMGYLLKDTPVAHLLDAVRAAFRGETVLAPAVAARLVRRARSPQPSALTAREIEVLALVGEGMTNADIGRRLFIGEATVKTHLLRAFAKLEVDDRTAAVLRAIELGLLSAPGS